MITVFIPTMLQKITGGVKQVECQAGSVRQVIDQLDAFYPGIKDRLVEDEQEQRIVKWMARRRQAGETLERIAEKLNSHPVPTKRGGLWYGSTVSNILRRLGLPK